MQFNFSEITQGMNIQAFTNESDRVTQGRITCDVTAKTFVLSCIVRSGLKGNGLQMYY